jgi:hypothetical protein
MDHLKRFFCTENILGIFILAVCFLVLWPLSPRVNPAVSGVLLPSGTASVLANPLPADAVQVLQVLPPSAHVLGVINTMIHFDKADLSTNDRNLQLSIAFAKKQAAAAGANAIVVTEVGLQGLPGDPLNGFVTQSTAVDIG